MIDQRKRGEEFSSDKLDKMLSSQKSHDGDKSRLGFMNSHSCVASTSSLKSNYEKKVVLVHSSGDKGKKLVVEPNLSRPKSRFFTPS